MISKWTIGVDFGGTNIKLGLVSKNGHVVGFQRLDSQGSSRPLLFIDRIVEAVGSLTRSVGIRSSQLIGVGVGAPGPVDSKRGVVRFLVNVPGWRDVPLGQWLERRLRCPCVVDNDVNLFTMGEWRFGGGRGARSLVGLTLGTGVGGGLVLDGSIYRGASGAAGELGHIIVDPNGRRCGCGARGCLEAYVGTEAILWLGRRLLRTKPQGSLCALIRRKGLALSPQLLAEAARRKDASACAIWNQVGYWLGMGLASVVNLLNPERVVIGGGISNAWGLFFPSLRRTMRAHAMNVSSSAVRVVRARLGKSAGIVGAAVLVWEQL